MSRERGLEDLKHVVGQARCHFKHALERTPMRLYAVRKDFQSPQRGTHKSTSKSSKEKSNWSSLAHVSTLVQPTITRKGRVNKHGLRSPLQWMIREDEGHSQRKRNYLELERHLQIYLPPEGFRDSLFVPLEDLCWLYSLKKENFQSN